MWTMVRSNFVLLQDTQPRNFTPIFTPFFYGGQYPRIFHVSYPVLNGIYCQDTVKHTDKQIFTF
jgi:hypothetical protein